MVNIEVENMISQHLVGRGVYDERVLTAFRTIERKYFVPHYLVHRAYEAVDIPIGMGQSIVMPSIMGLMLQSLKLNGGKVLEVGTGSGYQTALLMQLADQVYSLEIAPEMLARAKKRLREINLQGHVEFNEGDGYFGWSEKAPFDAIIVNGASLEVPDDLQGQLRDGGHLVMGIFTEEEGPQSLVHVSRHGDEFETSVLEIGELSCQLPILEGEFDQDFEGWGRA